MSQPPPPNTTQPDSPSNPSTPSSLTPPPIPIAEAPSTPRWGMGDILLGIPFILVFAVAGTLGGAVLAPLFGDSAIVVGGAASTAAGAVLQQFGMTLWPAVVTKWKGASLRSDWRLAFRPIDALIGFGVGFGSLVASVIVGGIVITALDIDTDEIEGNTGFLTDVDRGPLFLAVMLLVTVVGAPISEELFFRGLVLRAVERRVGVGVAITVSSVLFTLVHYTGGTGADTIVLFVSVGIRGVLFAVVTVMTGRLGPAMIAHSLSNLIAVSIALATT